jgi:hypothetical protein
MFGIRVERKAAPGPVFRMIDQFSFQRIHVHVVEFFDSLFQTPNVKVIESALPELARQGVFLAEAQGELVQARGAFAAQAARDALLQDLHDSGGRSPAGSPISRWACSGITT